MSYKLFSATHRCMPCKRLVTELDLVFPEWRSCVEYIDADNMTEEQRGLASSLGVMRLPTFTNEKEIINLNPKDFTSSHPREKARKIKELCTTKE
jgi:hypothetical protein